MLKIMIILAYFERTEIVKFALQSIKMLQYANFDFFIIDDGSQTKPHIHDIAWDVLGEMHYAKTGFYLTTDTPEQKVAQGGSRHGQILNEIIMASNSDLVIVLCDDDAIIPDYLTNLDQWFRDNPDKKYGYSHCRIFDPTTESPFGISKRPHWTNLAMSVHPVNRIDSSQVVFRTECFKKDGCRFPSPQTKNLDADLLQQFFDLYGPCSYMEFDGQYKGWFPGQLGNQA